MDTFFFILWSLLIAFIIFVIAIDVYYYFNKDMKLISLLPGPKCYPILGNVLEGLVPSDVLFQKLRNYARIYYPIYMMRTTTAYASVNLVRAEDMQKVLSSVKNNEKSLMYNVLTNWLQEGLLTSAGSKWIYRRKVLTPTFHFKMLNKFVPIFNRHSDIFSNELETLKSQVIDISQYVHKCSLHMIAEAAMGIRMESDKNEKNYRRAIHEMGQVVVYRVLRPWQYYRLTSFFTRTCFKERGLVRYLQQYTRNFIKEREKVFHPDDVQDELDDVGMKKNRLAMLDLLFYAKHKNEIDDAGIEEEVNTFMFEGHDTITMGISFCYMLLACHKEIQDKVYEEIASVIGDNKEPTFDELNNLEYTERVIKESLRLYPSVPLISRISGEEITTYTNNIIPSGTVLILHIYDLHRDPETYPDPEKFDPNRFLPQNVKARHPFSYLPFSAGSRNCIGQRYAMLSMKNMLVSMLSKHELLPVDTPETLVLVTDIILRSKNGIKIKLKPRVPS